MISSGFSFRRAAGKLDDVISRVQEIGWPWLPIADAVSTFAFVKMDKLATKAGLKPIFGVRLAVVPRLGDRKPVVDYFTFLSIDDLQPLHQLIGLATSNPGRDPSLTYAQAMNAKGVIKISGERVLMEEVYLYDATNFYVGLSVALPKATYKETKRLGYKFIAHQDNYYPRKEDKEFYRVTLEKRAATNTWPGHILSDEEWHRATAWFASQEDRDTAIATRNMVFGNCTAKLRSATLLVPEKPNTLRQMCEAGAVRLGIDLALDDYRTRLDRELALIEEKQFEDYFRIVADAMQWARARFIVGPGRGSSSGSLVCYLLQITEIDPVFHGLSFERFVDETRTELPDVDCDVPDQNKDDVFEYMRQKYGSDRVAKLGAAGSFKAASSIKAVGDALRIPQWQIEKVKETVIKRAQGDDRNVWKETFETNDVAREFLKQYPNAIIVDQIENHPVNATTHAAGVVLTQEPIINYVAVDSRNRVTMCDKEDAETLNLLKIDMLGLKQLSTVQSAMKLANIKDLPKIYDDLAVFDVVNKGHLAGIFQFSGSSLSRICKGVEVSRFEHLVAINALGRPGAMDAGAVEPWQRRMAGKEQPKYLHPDFEPILKETLGLSLYQEQVMRICREIGHLEWPEVHAVRRAIGKSKGSDEIDKYGKKFKSGAIAHGLEVGVADKAWADIITFGRYGFPKAHSLSYSVVAFWGLWLKAHHPLEFAAATLDAESDPAKQIALLRELASEGISYTPVDPDHSTDRWVPVDGKRLVGPLTQIKGIGPSTVREILDCRKSGKPIRETLRKKLLQARTEIDTLFPIRDTIHRLHPDLVVSGIVTEPTPIKDVQCGVVGDQVVLGVVERMKLVDENDATRVQRRGKRVTGPAQSINLFVRDDADEILVKIDRWKFTTLGKRAQEQIKPGKTLIAAKGECWSSFRGIGCENFKVLGEIDG